MAQMIAKIFQNRKYQNNAQNTRQQRKSNTKWHVTRFTKEDINLVLFKDCANSGKQAILDSRCLRRVTLEDVLCEKCMKLKKCGRRAPLCKANCPACPGVNASLSNVPKKYKNVCTGNKNDVKLVGEMIFGTTPLASSGTTVKVHSLKSPHQLMLSSVFQYKRCKDQIINDFGELDSFESSMYMPSRNSENNLASLGSLPASSRPVDMPSFDCNYYGSDTSLNLSVTSGSSLHTPLPSPGANSSTSINSCSRLSMMRRIRRSFNSSFQYNTATTTSGNTSGPSSGCDSPQPSFSECSMSTSGRRRGARIGMAIIFTLDEFDDSRRDFETFFFSHITLIEGQLVALRTAIENSACETNVIELVMEALDEFKNKVYDLYTARRLANPVWLSMMAASTHRYRICEKFVREFTILIDRYDTKSTNYFVSTLLTGVLMYHLAWVPTVTPSGEHHSSYAYRHSAKWLDMLAKSHPYNPLWAQLSDMYGAIGMPPRLARTIVTGKKMDTIVKFLFVLSYFIRCSEIHETLDECFDEENLLQQIESAVDDICVESMEKDATADQTDFVVVDAPSTSMFMQDTEGETDSGLVSQYTEQSKHRPKSLGKQDDESGFTEPRDEGSLADVKRVPSSSPADKVSEWIMSSQLTEPAVNEELNAAANPEVSPLHKSTTNSTLVAASVAASPSVTPASPTRITCLPPPPEAKVEETSHVKRAATVPSSLPELSDTKPKAKDSSSNLSSRSNILRLFSSEIEDMDDIFDGKLPSFSRQASNISRQSSSISQFDELFEDSDLDSFSMLPANSADDKTDPTEAPTPTNNRNMLFKVMKEAGFHQHGQQTPESLEQSTKEAKSVTAAHTPLSPVPSTDDQFRPRNLSVGKQSSRCSTPQTIMGGGGTTPGSCVGRCRKASMYQATLLDSEEQDPFNSYEELTMPRSTEVSKLADTSISTTSFGRQQLASFSDHYLSDFVLHGTSDDDVFPKVQKDLVASVEHSILEDRISEAVCVVADTERWCVNVCSSMREQPKPLPASHLVINMVENVSSLAKLKMSPEFILMHMEDRLQEMLFKSRMLSEYIHSQKKVDMDELDAMFGLEVSDIRFLLSVAGTHSMVNVHGIY